MSVDRRITAIERELGRAGEDDRDTVPHYTPEQRAAGIERIFAEAERPDATPEARERAARVRELLARAEARREAAQARGWAP
jgi:hypothetical protein